MFKKLAIIISMLVISFSFGITANANETDRLGAAYFTGMDLSESYLADVKVAVDAKDYDAAFTAYKKIVFDRIIERCEAGIYSTKLTDENLNRAKTVLEEDTITLTDRSNISETRYLGEAGSYEWIVGEDITDGAPNALLNDMDWASSLMAAYVQTGDTDYLDKWLVVWQDYDTNYLKDGTTAQIAAKKRMHYWPLATERKFNARIAALYNGLKYNYDEVMEHFGNEYFAHMTEQILDELANNDTDTITVANQILAGITAMIKNYSVFAEIPEAKNGFEYAGEVFTKYYENSYLKDTMDKEMSYNYNYGVIRNFYGIDQILIAIDEEPEWFDGMMEKARLRLRGLASLVMPQKILPNIAESYSAYDPNYYINTYKVMVEEDEVVERVLDNFWGDGSLPEPAFKSIAYPYVGYYIMREDWTEQSQFIFFRGGRYAVGHNDFGMLQVMYSDYGERLLIDSGPTSYGVLPIGNYLVSSAAHNTVMVDGYSQVWNRNEDAISFITAEDFAEPIDGIWHTSDKYDFAEAEYGYDYGVPGNIWDQKKEVTDVNHGRKVLMDKENHVAVVLDEVESEHEHEFQQQWNLAYKFNDYGLVHADKDKKHWTTTLDDGLAGVEIYTYTDKDIEYEIACGEDDPDNTNGWYLYEYGLNIQPNVHIETKWTGSGKQNVISLINATQDNESKIKCSETLNDGNGFSVKLNDGTKIAFISGTTDKNDISYNGIVMKAKLLYVSEKPNGVISGIAKGAVNVTYNGESAGIESYIQDFEFEIKDGEFNIVSIMNKPTIFEWKESDNGVVPYYGFDGTSAVRLDYVEY